MRSSLVSAENMDDIGPRFERWLERPLLVPKELRR